MVEWGCGTELRGRQKGGHWKLSSNPLLSKRIQVRGVLIVRFMFKKWSHENYVELYAYVLLVRKIMGFWEIFRNCLADHSWSSGGSSYHSAFWVLEKNRLAVTSRLPGDAWYFAWFSRFLLSCLAVMNKCQAMRFILARCWLLDVSRRILTREIWGSMGYSLIEYVILLDYLRLRI